MLALLQIRRLFIIVFFVNSILSLILSLLNMGEVIFVVSLISMTIYYFLGIAYNKSRQLSNEQFGDSNYYLGFLITLMSFLLILIFLDREVDLLRYIAYQFGTALISTVYGLTLRIYLVSFLPSTESNMEKVDTLLSDKLMMINNMIDSVVSQNKLYSDVQNEKLNLFIENIEKTLNQYTKTLVSSLEFSGKEAKKVAREKNDKTK